MRPRVGFDARLWQHTGIGRYIRNVLPRLEGLDLVVYATPADAEAVRQAVPAAAVRVCSAKPFSLAESLYWPRAFARDSLSLFHAPHLNVPLFGRVPLVVTLHDLIPLRFPGTINSGLGEAYFRAMLALAVRRASRLVAVSETTRADLVALAGADPSRIRVVGEGADPRFGVSAGAGAIARVRERFGLPGPYILYAGQWKPYKNLGTLIAAFKPLHDRHPTLRLVLAGREDPLQPHVPAAIAAFGLDAAVVRTGYLDDETLVALYQGARVFAFPSRYEGFGLPPLEAMAAGVPVVASRAASIPEVVGDAALLIPPDDVLRWEEALEQALHDESLRRELVARGRARVAALPWDAAARATLAVYHELLPS